MDRIVAALKTLMSRSSDTNWPCCDMVAHVQLIDLDLEDEHPVGGPWWAGACIWDHSPVARWSSVVAAMELARGPAATFLGVEAASDACEWLRPNSVYVVQGWKKNGWGHTFFMVTGPTPSHGAHVVESSETLGLRIGGKRWRGGTIPGAQTPMSRLTRFDAGVALARIWSA